jgi:LytTr DNA-binding domain
MAAELGFLLLIGLLLGFIGPFGTAEESTPEKYGFWLAVIIAGGLIGIAIDKLLDRRIRNDWARLIVIAATMSLPITFLVFGAMLVVLGHDHDLSIPLVLGLFSQVFVISLAVMAMRLLAHRPRRIVETRTVTVPPLPGAGAAFRRRLSARHRSATLFAIEAHDHYVRVHTDAGEQLLSLRFSDALAELSGAPGFQVHRSWWVAADAIEAARWRRGRGEVELVNGMMVPISRNGAPVLRMAGWL